jgi:hypothetical protein
MSTVKMFISSQALPAALNVVAKALFGIFISFVVAVSVELKDALLFFQLLFAQSILITLISGSSYVKASAISSDRLAVRRYLFSQVKIAAGVSVTSLLLVFLYLVVSDERGGAAQSLLVVVSILILGGVAAGFVAFFQGYLVNSINPFRVYCVSILVHVLGGVLLAVVHNSANIVVLSIIIASVPVATAFIYFWIYLRAPQEVEGIEVGGQSPQFFWLGLVNTVYLLGILGVRELWKDAVDVEVAVLVFFLLRVSDVILQIPFLIIGGNLHTLKEIENRFVRDNANHIAFWAVFVSLATSASIQILFVGSGLIILICCQVLVDVTRLTAIVPIISTLATRSTICYALMLFTSVCLAVLLMLFFEVDGAGYLYIFLIWVSTFQILFYLLIRSVECKY